MDSKKEPYDWYQQIPLGERRIYVRPTWEKVKEDFSYYEGMKDILIRLASLGMSLHFEREGMQMGIKVTHIESGIECLQLLPLDHHLQDERLERCIDYCVTDIHKKRESPGVSPQQIKLKMNSQFR